MDRTDEGPDPDDLLEPALTDPESYDAARTARLVAALEHDDDEVRRAASWAIRFVAAETPSLVGDCAGRFRRALRDPDARPAALRTLAVAAEHDREAVADIVDGAVEERTIDGAVARRVVAGYRPVDPTADGSVVTDEGDETDAPTSTAAVGDRDDSEASSADGAADADDAETAGYPPSEPPTKPPRLDRSLTEYEPDAARGRRSESPGEQVRFTEGGREFTGTHWRSVSVGAADEDEYRSALDRWRRIDDHDAVARVVDGGTRPTPWLVSERGGPDSLAERHTPFPPSEARWVLAQIADAVQYAHAAGVVHGGLQPASVAFVNAVEDPDAWAYPRVGDWGLRETFGPSEGRFELPRRYAAPEHVAPDRFGRVDAATDIYGLGALGCELLTGGAPVREERTAGLPEGVAAGLPAELSTVLAKCLKPAKMERYASAAAFKRELAAGGDDA